MFYDAATRTDDSQSTSHLSWDAATSGNIEAVKQHIAAGTDVNARRVIGDTPLDGAIQRKRTETIDLLRKHGGKTGDELKVEGK